MAEKTKIDLVFDDVVASGATDIKESVPIPNGKKVTLKIFGGVDPNIGDNKDSWAALQWGKTGAWDTIRVGAKMWNIELRKDFMGDGIKKFRLLRKNNSTTDKKIVVWLEALIHNA